MKAAISEATTTLLAVDDDPQTLALIVDALQQLALRIVTAKDASAALQLFSTHRPQIVLADLMMPGMSGIELLERIIELDAAAEVILMTGHYSPESAVEAIKKGASDYFSKPLNLSALRSRITAIQAEASRRTRALQLDRELLETFRFEGVVGRSPAMLDVFATLRRAAPHFRTALITGPTGVGKELVARALHTLSPVAKKELIICNCTAITETLYESELFGYVRGAFTGANQDKIGMFEYANGGSIFLDEIGDMPLSGQSKLLRVLQNQEIQRVGSPASKRVDVRVIAATNRDLRQLVREQKFREDLYYRLSMIEIKLPRLIDRMEDLPLLQRHFLEKFKQQFRKDVRGLTRRAQQVLARHSWPGNVRELENVIGNACIMADSPAIDVDGLPEYLVTHTESNDDDVLSMEEVQRRHVLKVVERLGGNKAKAADALGISRTTLYSILGRRMECEQESAVISN
jgi:DNA-binding NtrC family response regulator